MVINKIGKKKKKDYLSEGVTNLDPLSYIEARGFLLFINSPAGLVYRHSADSDLHLYVQLEFNMVQLIYDNDFSNPLYKGCPTVEEFHQVLTHTLYEGY